ncbi:DUF1858 domain-containing protein [Hydrogenimonas sp.]
MVEITPKTKVHDLLEAYPQLEAFLIDLNPKYRKLKNPILRRTVAKIATLTQVAKIGGYGVTELVNLLRKEVGQPPMEAEEAPERTEEEAPPLWLSEEPATILDANALLDEEKNPLAETAKALRSLESGEILLIESDFLPAPLIDTFKEQGHEVYSAQESPGHFLTYIRKS